jgi:DNA-binding XRE family transcriptional regulator
MGYLLRMSAEIHDWLADLGRGDPPAALLVGEALTALMREGASLGAPLVTSVADPRPGELAEALNRSYQVRMEQLQVARRRAAGVASLVHDARSQLAELEPALARLEDQRRAALAADRPEEAATAADQLAAAERDAAELRRMLPQLTGAERRLRAQLEQLQERTDAFRVRTEVLKATHTAARAELLIEEAAASSDQAADAAATPPDAAATPPDAAATPPDAAATPPDAASGEAAGRLRAVADEIERELGRQPWPEGLSELRPGAPGDGQIRILFAVEPAGTALLIAVLDGYGAIRSQYSEAVTLAAEALRAVRAGQAPEAAERGYDDLRSFLQEFFPGQAAQLEAGAAALVARSRARTLAEQRTRLGLTQAELAQRMGVRQERVSAIERAEPGATEVRTLASYVAALGGRLDLVADFGTERVLLR